MAHYCYRAPSSYLNLVLYNDERISGMGNGTFIIPPSKDDAKNSLVLSTALGFNLQSTNLYKTQQDNGIMKESITHLISQQYPNILRIQNRKQKFLVRISGVQKQRLASEKYIIFASINKRVKRKFIPTKSAIYSTMSSFLFFLNQMNLPIVINKEKVRMRQYLINQRVKGILQ